MGLVVVHRLVLTQSDHINLVRRNVVLGAEVLNHRRRAPLAQTIVVVCRANRVRSTFHRNDVALGVGNNRGQLVEFIFGVFAQEVLVEAKVHSGFVHDAIVVEIRDRIGKHANPVHGVVSRSLCLGSLVAGGLRLLIGGGGGSGHLLNAGLGPGVNVLDRLAVLRGQVVKLIGFVDDRGGLLFDIILAGATYRRQHACSQQND